MRLQACDQSSRPSASASRSCLGSRTLGAGPDLLAQAEFVEVERRTVAGEVGTAFGPLDDDERVAVLWSFRQDDSGPNCWTADERSSSPPRRPHEMHPASMGRGRWR